MFLTSARRKLVSTDKGRFKNDGCLPQGSPIKENNKRNRANIVVWDHGSCCPNFLTITGVSENLCDHSSRKRPTENVFLVLFTFVSFTDVFTWPFILQYKYNTIMMILKKRNCLILKTMRNKLKFGFVIWY